MEPLNFWVTELLFSTYPTAKLLDDERLLWLMDEAIQRSLELEGKQLSATNDESIPLHLREY
jgi:hypothetical protein